MSKRVVDRGNGQKQVADEAFETLVADSSNTPTAAMWVKGFIRQVPTAARALTTSTAAELDSVQPNAQVGDSFTTTVCNMSAGAFAVTFVAGANVTLKPTASISIGQNKTGQLIFVKTAAGYDCYQVLGA